MNQQQLIALLLQAINGGNQQQNPLQQLLGGQQNRQQDILSLLTGGGNQNPLQSLLGGAQQPQLDANTLTLLVQQLQGGQQPQQQPQIDPQILTALQTALGGQNGNAGKGNDLLELLKGKTDNSQEEDLRDAIKFNLEFGKFIEDYQDCFPSWFDPKEATEQVEKWAKTDSEKAQALAAATVKAFFKNEDAMELLEERDRNFVKENILKEGIKDSQIDRKLAWPMMQRAIHNKTTMGNALPSAGGAGEENIAKFGERFESGQKTAQSGE
ncbi:hypothetical protein [Vibrio parahaemolyticus]|uniref:hypothetical protein n=1 Tax=Vibrio parahaemolyticus TaxID=670 RepID=UPI00111F4D02|nr:hypothetical protein [Vibrio parahaemolyticus]TON00547.1 hypothetical protein CGH66_02320 [Vibrio parahaemolyticus]TON06170.1 hypothetical protein CGH67_14100 [Vibrio parahaemolyticus]TON14974.1 hypothetical protein CGH64_19560 [Vibrio parahaemolyticus]TON31949.1 hypothetical protein CGH59_18350 [Vibrio parahaemolyticus]TON48972.1 hypothetical protein CGH55_20220 [Vibrio parahaemolyticus]